MNNKNNTHKHNKRNKNKRMNKEGIKHRFDAVKNSKTITQGIGFIYKKDFNKWNDLFQWLMRKQNQKKDK